MANPQLITFTLPFIDFKKNKKGELKKDILFTVDWKKEIEEIKNNQKKYNKVKDKIFSVLTGKVNNITVIDFDDLDIYNNFCDKHPELINTFRVKTRSGCYHLYYNYNPSWKTTTNIAPKIDIRNDDAIVFGAGSICEDGSSYTIDNDVSYLDLPDELLEEFKQIKEQEQENVKIEIKYPKQKNEKFKKEKPDKIIKDNQEIDNTIYEIIDLISPEYIEDYSSWWRIITAIANEDLDKEFARKISQKTDNYELKAFEKCWDNAYKYDKLTTGTLKYYGRMSNQERYFEILAKEKKNFMGLGTETDIATLFIELVGDDVIYSKDNLYYYHEGQWLVGNNIDNLIKNKVWKYINKFILLVFKPLKEQTKILKDEINKLEEECEDKKDDDLSELTDQEKKNVQKEIKKKKEELETIENKKKNMNNIKKQLGKVSFLNNVLSALKMILSPNLLDIDFDVNEEQIYNIQFKNRVYMLDKKESRLRRKDDYVSKILDWNLKERKDIPQKIFDDVMDFFVKIQPDHTDRTFTISWLAYCLQGKNPKQKMKMNIGYTAENGKSTELNIHSRIFPIYTEKLSAETFNINYSKRHKQLRQLLEEPVRLAYIEEMKDEKLDGDFLKDFVDGTKIDCEILFGTKIAKPIQSKLMTCGNRDFNLRSCKGVERRGLVQFYNSKFKKFDEDVDETKHYYKRVDNFENRFDDEDYKNAYFYILLDHYNHGELKIPEKNENSFKQIMDDYDELDSCILYKYEFSDDPEDKIHKTDILNYLNDSIHDGKQIIKNHHLQKEIKKHGIGYSAKQRIHGSKQGVYTNIKIKDSFTKPTENCLI